MSGRGEPHPPEVAALPHVHAVAVTAAGVWALFDTDQPRPPIGWRLGADSRSWFLAHGEPVPTPQTQTPRLAALGRDERDGTSWWANLRAVRLVIDGEDAHQLAGLWTDQTSLHPEHDSGPYGGTGPLHVVDADSGKVTVRGFGLVELTSPCVLADDGPLLEPEEDPTLDEPEEDDRGEDWFWSDERWGHHPRKRRRRTVRKR